MVVMPAAWSFLRWTTRHSRHHQQVAVQADLFCAVVAPAAVDDAWLLPPDRPAALPVFGGQLAEAPAPFAEHGQQVRQGVAAAQPVLAHAGAQHQGDDGGGVQPHPEELVTVGRQLQQGAHLGVPGELGVPDLVPARRTLFRRPR